MITGGNSGIGKCIALDIAKRGGTVHLVCRNAKSAEEAKNEIIKDSGNQVDIWVFLYNTIKILLNVHLCFRMFPFTRWICLTQKVWLCLEKSLQRKKNSLMFWYVF